MDKQKEILRNIICANLIISIISFITGIVLGIPIISIILLVMTFGSSFYIAGLYNKIKNKAPEIPVTLRSNNLELIEKTSEIISSVENLQLLLGSTEDTIFEINKEGNCQQVWHGENSKHLFQEKKFIGQSVKQIFDEKFNTQIDSAFRQVLETGLPKRIEFSFNINEKTSYFQTKINKVKDSNHPRVSIVLEDITSQKESELRQTQQSAFLNKLIDHLPLGIFIKNVKSDLSYSLWNKHLEQLFDLKQEDVLGKTDEEVFQNSGEIKNYLETDRMVLESKEPLLIEKLNIKAGENHIIARTFKIPILDPQGEVELIVGILENITDVVKVQQDLEIAEKRWNYALSGSRDAVWDVNLVTRETFFSPMFNEMLGYLDSESITQKWEELVHPYDLPEIIETFNKHLSGETPYFEAEYRLRKKDQSYIWILDRGKIAESDDYGNATRIIGTFTNISYRKNLEQEYIFALRKAEEGSRAKSLFLSTMSHEIRTPMNGVIGIINLLLNENPKPEQIENLNALQISADNLMSLLNDILDFSKIDAGKLEIEESSFNLVKLLQNTLKPFLHLKGHLQSKHK